MISALGKFIGQARTNNDERLLLEALWLYQSHNVVNPNLLDKLLGAQDFRVRAAATRIVGDWNLRLDDPLNRLRRSISDDHPRVRLEAIRACSFIDEPEALDVALEALNYDMDDKYLGYTLEQTMRVLESR